MNRVTPSLFVSHGGGPAFLLDFAGSPFAEIDRNSPSAEFTRNLRQYIKSNENVGEISSILVVTAHWEEEEFTVDYPVDGKSKLIYDYYGFPKESYDPFLTYPASIDLKLADHVVTLLSDANIKCNKADRGLDHGTFIPLKVAFPSADIPVVQLSLKANLNIAEHIKLGEVLAPLKREGVLIIGSGQVTHNLAAIRQPAKSNSIKCKEFTEWLSQLLESVTDQSSYETAKQALINIHSTGPHFNFNHPRIEHFVPLCVAFGTTLFAGIDSQENEGQCEKPVRRVFSQQSTMAMALDSYLFN